MLFRRVIIAHAIVHLGPYERGVTYEKPLGDSLIAVSMAVSADSAEGVSGGPHQGRYYVQLSFLYPLELYILRWASPGV